MISDLDVLKTFGALARHAAESQRVSAENVANAANPGYRAEAVESFETFMKRVEANPSLEMTKAEFRHLKTEGPSAPNGNNVSLEQELFISAEASGQHELAMSAYSKTIGLIKAALGRQR
ncbi:MAG: flagellar biosynthesis protein FlgB [Pseudomonadota bacterium]